MGAPLLIVGLDPGTTLAYAAFDLEGKPIKIFSGKNIDRDELIKKITALGKTIVIAGDKQYNPGLIEKVAIKLGAKTIAPEYDLKVNEKRILVKHIKTKNQHEIDASAAALIALKSIKPLLKKIDVFVTYNKKESIKEKLIPLVVIKELNIRDAAELIEEKPKPIIKEIIKEVVMPTEAITTLRKKLKAANKALYLSQLQHNKFKKETKKGKEHYERKIKQLTKQNLNKKLKQLLSIKEERIMQLEKQQKVQKREKNGLKENIATLLYLLSSIGESILLKKLDNLGFHELNRKNGILHIGNNDILLVKDPDMISPKTIQAIQNKVQIIVTKKQVSKKLQSSLPFIFLNANLLSIEESEHFALTSKEEFDKVKKEQHTYKEMIEKYQKARV